MKPEARQRTFLAFMFAFALLLLVAGAWEWAVAGAIHQLLLGAITLALTGLAWLYHRRARDP